MKPLLFSFSELRRESRRLENEIDAKLVSFGKLSSSFLRRESRSVKAKELLTTHPLPTRQLHPPLPPSPPL